MFLDTYGDCVRDYVIEEDIREVVLGVLSLDHVTESSLVTINLLLSDFLGVFCLLQS